MLLTAALSCAPTEHHCAMSARVMSGASALGTLCFRSLVRHSRYMHHVCVWLACELAQLSGIARWSLRVAIAAGRCAELSPFHLSLCHVGQRCLGLQHFLYSVFWVCSRVRATTAHDICVWLGCELWRSFQVVARWSLQVASAADRCAELSPFHASLRHVGQRCQGLQRLGTLRFGSLVRQSR